MEELFVYAVFLINGFDVEDEYNVLLDKLFMNDPENKDYLELEMFGGNISESIVYIFTHSDTESFDIENFGKLFVDLLRRFYKSTINEYCNCRNKSEQFALEEFARRSNDISKTLPQHFQQKDPFYIMLYADEPLSWGILSSPKNYIIEYLTTINNRELYL